MRAKEWPPHCGKLLGTLAKARNILFEILAQIKRLFGIGFVHDVVNPPLAVFRNQRHSKGMKKVLGATLRRSEREGNIGQRPIWALHLDFDHQVPDSIKVLAFADRIGIKHPDTWSVGLIIGVNKGQKRRMIVLTGMRAA